MTILSSLKCSQSKNKQPTFEIRTIGRRKCLVWWWQDISLIAEPRVQLGDSINNVRGDLDTTAYFIIRD